MNNMYIILDKNQFEIVQTLNIFLDIVENSSACR